METWVGDYLASTPNPEDIYGDHDYMDLYWLNENKAHFGKEHRLLNVHDFFGT